MMGRTLFWYLFRDLLKIFFMANGALTGIMSFGGLLRPLTHQGLDVAQVGTLLGYFSIAMVTYSFPIAALFATTVVYGRLSADNELTACRAGGLSHVMVALPAFILGIFVAILSLVFLCFIVPVYTMKVEQTLYSNMAKLIAGNIQRNHKIEFGAINIFAQEAYIPPPNANSAGQQMVVLKGPTIESIERPYLNQPEFRDYHVPKDFYTASEAVIYIEQRGKGDQRGNGKVYLTLHLEDGLKFPREFNGAIQAGVETTDYGPIEIESPIKEDTKFMDIRKLKKIYDDPEKGAKVKRVVDELVQRDQQQRMADQIADEINGVGTVTFHFAEGETYVLKREPSGPPAQSDKGEVIIPAALPVDQLSAWAASQAATDAGAAALGLPPIPGLPMAEASDKRPITFQRQIAGQSPPVMAAREAHLQIHFGGEPDTMRLTLELIDATSQTGGGQVERKSYIQSFNVPMPADVQGIAAEGLKRIQHADPNSWDRRRVDRALLALGNNILSESHSRVSFAISCLVLVMVGCSLGMMFRSGNFLSAFAISFIPALLTITLIVAGQRVSGNVPEFLTGNVAKYVNSPLQLGLGLIWAGNCANFVLAVGLLGRLQKK
jgi:lipopolysaccharide export LptBFGC system permease protein LptF